MTLLQKITIEAFFGYKIQFGSMMGCFFFIKIKTTCGLTNKVFKYKQVLGKEAPTEDRVIKCIDFMIDEIRKKRSEDQET